jgi:hypothetical protein
MNESASQLRHAQTQRQEDQHHTRVGRMPHILKQPGAVERLRGVNRDIRREGPAQGVDRNDPNQQARSE